MKLIAIPQGEFVKVDDEDYEFLNQVKWHLKTNRSVGRMGYKNGQRVSIYMHHVILKLDSDLFKGNNGIKIIHKNGDRLDNQKNNLIISRQQHLCQHRKKMKKATTSKYKGVHWCTQANGWRAGIKLNGKYKYLKVIHDEEEAARIYDEAAKKYFGKFALLNFSEKVEA